MENDASSQKYNCGRNMPLKWVDTETSIDKNRDSFSFKAFSVAQERAICVLEFTTPCLN
jgi:hypothetical protein